MIGFPKSYVVAKTPGSFVIFHLTFKMEVKLGFFPPWLVRFNASALSTSDSSGKDIAVSDESFSHSPLLKTLRDCKVLLWFCLMVHARDVNSGFG